MSLPRFPKNAVRPEDVARALQIVHKGGLAGKSLAGDGNGRYEIAAGGVQVLHLASGIPAAVPANGGLSLDTLGNLSGAGFRILTADPSAAVDGDAWYNSADKVARAQTGGVTRDLVGLLNATSAASNTITNTAVETYFTTAVTLPADALRPGRVIRWRGSGLYNATGVRSIRLRFYLGATVIFDYGARTPSVATGSGWDFEANYVCAVSGAGGSVGGFGFINFSTFALPYVSGTAAPVAVNTTGALDVKCSALWSAANAGEAIYIQSSTVEAM